MGLGMLDRCRDRPDTHGMEVLFEFTVPVFILINAMDKEFTISIHNQFTEWADLVVLPNGLVDNHDGVLCINGSKFPYRQDHF